MPGLNLNPLNEKEIKDWLVLLGRTDQERVERLKELLIAATEDDMNKEDKRICLEILEDLTGYEWAWGKRKDSRSYDTITRVAKEGESVH